MQAVLPEKDDLAIKPRWEVGRVVIALDEGEDACEAAVRFTKAAFLVAMQNPKPICSVLMGGPTTSPRTELEPCDLDWLERQAAQGRIELDGCQGYMVKLSLDVEDGHLVFSLNAWTDRLTRYAVEHVPPDALDELVAILELANEMREHPAS